MKQTLTDKGWNLYHECQSCGGKAYFSNKLYSGYHILLQEKSSVFSIWLNNFMVAGPLHFYGLDEALRKHNLS